MSTALAEGPATEEQTAARALANVDSGGDFSALLDDAKFGAMWRAAGLFAASQLVPQHFRGKREDCFIACHMAIRLGVDPFMFMQNTYVVHGRPGMEAKLAIALINTSGLFDGGLKYERVGDHATTKSYKVRCFAIRLSNGERIDGPWIDWNIVEKEGWDKKEGSKWKTIPALMFDYRAATWFGRLNCPERLMGMQTADELEDIAPVRVVEAVSTTASRVSSAIAETKAKLQSAPPAAAQTETAPAKAESASAAAVDPADDWENQKSRGGAN